MTFESGIPNKSKRKQNPIIQGAFAAGIALGALTGAANPVEAADADAAARLQQISARYQGKYGPQIVLSLKAGKLEVRSAPNLKPNVVMEFSRNTTEHDVAARLEESRFEVREFDIGAQHPIVWSANAQAQLSLARAEILESGFEVGFRGKRISLTGGKPFDPDTRWRMFGKDSTDRQIVRVSTVLACEYDKEDKPLPNAYETVFAGSAAVTTKLEGLGDLHCR